MSRISWRCACSQDVFCCTGLASQTMAAMIAKATAMMMAQTASGIPKGFRLCGACANCGGCRRGVSRFGGGRPIRARALARAGLPRELEAAERGGRSLWRLLLHRPQDQIRFVHIDMHFADRRGGAIGQRGFIGNGAGVGGVASETDSGSASGGVVVVEGGGGWSGGGGGSIDSGGGMSRRILAPHAGQIVIVPAILSVNQRIFPHWGHLVVNTVHQFLRRTAEGIILCAGGESSKNFSRCPSANSAPSDR